MIVNETNISQKVTVELEKEIAAILDTKVNDLKSGRVEIYQLYFLSHPYIYSWHICFKRALRESQEVIVVYEVKYNRHSYPSLLTYYR